jgi:recombination protein RecA
MSALPIPAESRVVDRLTQRHPQLRVQRNLTPLPGAGGLPEAPATGAPLAARWSFAGLAGRLVEISGAARSAGLTLAVRLVAEAQGAGDIAAWVCGPDGCFYPPDTAGHGVDLARLAVIRVPTAESVARAGIRLAQSGGFGLVVLDLTASFWPLPQVSGQSGWPLRQASGQSSWPLRQASGQSSWPLRQASGADRVSDAHLGRLAQQGQRHEVTIVCLTRKSAQRDSLGSLVSVRAEAQARRVGPDRFLCAVQVLKDKRNGAGWRHEEVFGGPPGLH